MSNLLSEVRAFLSALPKKPQRVLLGVSGGVDSMVLLDVFARLRLDLGLEVFVAHLDHGLREESVVDSKFVEQECLDREVQCYTRRVLPPSSNIEAWGREERYEFFYQLLDQQACDYLVTAHHQNDLSETFLFRLLSGRFNNLGLAIKAIDEARSLIRPLIGNTKDEIFEYAKANKVAYREDSSNQDQTYRRNFIRHSVSPVLKEFEPTWEEHLCEYSGFVEELEQYVLGEAKKFVGSSLVEKQTLPDVLLQRVLYLESAEVLKEDALKISRDRILDLVNLIKAPQSYKRECDLGFGFYAVIDRSGAENAQVIYLRRGEDACLNTISEVSPQIYDINFAQGIKGRVEFFSSKEACENAELGNAETSKIFFHAFPIDDLSGVQFLFSGQVDRVNIGEGRTRSVSKIYKDEKWNEERRSTTVFVSNGEASFLLATRFYPIDYRQPAVDNYIYCRFSILN